MDSVAVRYIVDDMDQAIAFYRDRLGFDLERHPAPGFAMLRSGSLRLLLNVPGAGGAGRAVNGSAPQAGGWNRFQLTVRDVDEVVARLRETGVEFRSDVISGQGGRQALVEDPAGNLIELFEPHGQSIAAT